MNKMIEKPLTLFQQKMKENITKSKDKSLVHDLIKLQLFKNSEKNIDSTVLIDLYNFLGLEKFLQFIARFSGVKLTVPTKDSFHETILIALCYYYKEIEGKNWQEIKSLLNIPDLSSIKYGMKLNQLHDFIKIQLNRMFSKDKDHD